MGGSGSGNSCGVLEPQVKESIAPPTVHAVNSIYMRSQNLGHGLLLSQAGNLQEAPVHPLLANVHFQLGQMPRLPSPHKPHQAVLFRKEPQQWKPTRK